MGFLCGDIIFLHCRTRKDFMMEIEPIAYIHTDFKEKFGIPRQSGRVASLVGKVVFLPKYSREDAFRALDGFSHLWLIFDFSKAHCKNWSPTVRPPRLGGNQRVGVFASRSPFRPNPLGLSSVRLLGIERSAQHEMVLSVGGADLLDGTPIFDVKPYLPSADCRPDAIGGYADAQNGYRLSVDFPKHLLGLIAKDKQCTVIDCLAEDPRPSYHYDKNRVYHMLFDCYEITFLVENLSLKVLSVHMI